MATAAATPAIQARRFSVDRPAPSTPLRPGPAAAGGRPGVSLAAGRSGLLRPCPSLLRTRLRPGEPADGRSMTRAIRVPGMSPRRARGAPDDLIVFGLTWRGVRSGRFAPGSLPPPDQGGYRRQARHVSREVSQGAFGEEGPGDRRRG